MAKKKIVGKTKLKSGIQPGSSTKSLNLLSPKKKSIAKTYRLKEHDLERLREISKAVNSLCSSHISDTDLIRALILMGSKFQKEKIINALKQL